MVFSSSLFLFAFLPITYILYNVLPGTRAKNNLLTVMSLLFYSFGRIDWLFLLVLSVLCNYLAGILMLRYPNVKKLTITVALCINIGMLCVFKYLNFFSEALNMLPFVDLTPTNIALPIGISFFTFQGMSYIIDVYRRPDEAATSFGKVLLYIAFFPQLIAGPIVKYSDISSQIDQRQITPQMTVSGINRFVKGLVKKLFFANSFAVVADAVYGFEGTLCDFRLAWLGVIYYCLQIYYDFSAYSDMAIGLGRMFGFKINENFNHPYCASSVKDFWRRWHISLSSWFREYLYIPLGGNRCSAVRTRINRLIVFFFTGMWHGANWPFIIWGLWHGLFLTLEDVLSKKKIKLPALGNIYTLWVVLMGFTLFRADNISSAFNMLKAMYTGFDITYESTAMICNLFTPSMVFMLFAGIIFAMPVVGKVRKAVSDRGIKISEGLGMAFIMLVFVACVLKLAASSFNPFIYTQF